MQNNVKRETCDSDEREKVVDKKFLVREPRLKFWSPKLRIFWSGRAPEPADAVNGFWPAINIPLFQELSSQKSKLTSRGIMQGDDLCPLRRSQLIDVQQSWPTNMPA